MEENRVEKDQVSYTIDAEDAGGRIDATLARLHPALSRNRLKELILSGAVSVNGQKIGEPKLKVKPSDEIILQVPPAVDADPKPQDIPLDILYEDNDIIVINKPVGMVVHPAPGSPDNTLVNALLFHCGDSLAGIGGVKRPGIVHRLDKDTSGVMVAAKTEHAHNHLAAQFADHGRNGPLERSYTAYAWGRTETYKGTVDAPLGRDANNRLKQSVRKDGRVAITHYGAKARFGGAKWDITRLACQLETGRTHQIRVHMAHINHPLIADPLYASGYATKAGTLPDSVKAVVTSLRRQALHAAELGFEHPVSKEEMNFKVPLPADLQQLEDALAPFNLATTGKT